MASTHSYPMDYTNIPSGVLDLSTSRKTSTSFYLERNEVSPQRHSMDQIMSTHPKIESLIYPKVESNCRDTHYRQSPSANETSYQNYHNENESPVSRYNSASPEEHSRQESPTFGSGYHGVDQISHYVLHAAFQQQLALKQNAAPRSIESDVASEAGSDASQHSTPHYSMPLTNREGKATRPFKAYPKDPLSLAIGFASVDTHSAEKFTAFREEMLKQICKANGGQPTVSNPRMRRTVNTNNNYSEDGSKSKYPSKDSSYTERRKKNNEAAKKSRDRRRIKEDELAIRAAFLERELLEMRVELNAAKNQLAALGIALPSQTPN